MIGQIISHYRILEKLGEGGMGVVYRAEDTALQRMVALKFLPPELTRDAEAKQRFLHEARAAARLDHPNICAVHEIGETGDGSLYIVMACYEGKTLRERLQLDPLPWAEAAALVLQAAVGLAEAHARGIVHRDIKPANLFATADGAVKILDFGLAKLAGASILTRSGSTLGTAAYMAPEQVSGEMSDARSDLWSLGVVLYELVAGRPPFRGEYAQAVMYGIVHEAPLPLAKLGVEAPPELQAVLDRCLAKDPAGRFASAQELAAALGACLGREAPTQPVVHRGFRGVEAWWRRGVIRVAALAVLAVALAVAGVIVWRSRQPGTEAPGKLLRLAVLPLANLSGDAGQDYLAAGLHEALITDLAQLGGLKRVIARASVMRFGKTDKSPREIAAELGVDALITGSVLRSGDRVRVTAQLVRGDTEDQLWAGRYERDMRDVLTLENDIVAAITREIRLQLTPQEHKRLASSRPVNPEAYEACLKGRFHYLKLSPKEIDTAERYFQLALEKDPGYAPAYEGMARIWSSRTDIGLISPSEALSRARAFVRKALELDDSLAEAHVTLANQHVFVWDWATADKEFRRALEINPNSWEAHFMYADYLITLRRTAEWREVIHRGLELDPVSSFTRSFYGWHLIYERRYDEAIDQLVRVVQEEPNLSYTHMGLWQAYFKKGMDAEALAEAKIFFGILGDQEVVRALDAGWTQGGYRGALKRAGDLLAARCQKTYYPAIRIARVYAHAGEKERTLEFLEKADQRHETPMYHIGVGPEWDLVRDDPRYQTLLRRMNLPADEK
jgi:TolB-like protein/Tfp pilus assembly protein PilF